MLPKYRDYTPFHLERVNIQAETSLRGIMGIARRLQLFGVTFSEIWGGGCPSSVVFVRENKIEITKEKRH
eukprot:Awhi_evm2s10481